MIAGLASVEPPCGDEAEVAQAPGGGDGECILSVLRSETRAVHRRAEAHIERMGDRIDVAGYGALLRVLLPVHAAIEARIDSFDEWATLSPPLDVAARSRSPLLLADLRSLGAVADDCGPSTIAPPPLEHFGEAFGALYVLEGSRLGGAVLARRIARANAALGRASFRFLRSDGTDVGPSWRQLRAALTGYAVDRARQRALVAGAAATFACFDEQLAGWSC